MGRKAHRGRLVWFRLNAKAEALAYLISDGLFIGQCFDAGEFFAF